MLRPQRAALFPYKPQHGLYILKHFLKNQHYDLELDSGLFWYVYDLNLKIFFISQVSQVHMN